MEIHTDNVVERNNRDCRRRVIIGDRRSTSRTTILFGAILVSAMVIDGTIGDGFGSGNVVTTGFDERQTSCNSGLDRHRDIEDDVHDISEHNFGNRESTPVKAVFNNGVMGFA